MKVLNRVSLTVIGFQLTWYLISVASEVIASDSLPVIEPTEKTMDENTSALLTSNILSRKELLFSSQIIDSQLSPTPSHRVLGKTLSQVNFLFATKTQSLEKLPTTTGTGISVVSSATRSHVFSSREIPDIAGHSKSSKQPEIRNTPLVSRQNGIYLSADTSFLSSHNSENKASTTLRGHIAYSVKLEQTSVKYKEVLNSPSSSEKTTPNLSGKYSVQTTRSTTQVNESPPLNIALSIQMFSKYQTATNIQIATIKKVAMLMFSEVVSTSSITSIENNSKSRGSPAAVNKNSIETKSKINISGTNTAQSLVISEPVGSSKPFITATSLEKLRISDTAASNVKLSSSASLEKNAKPPTETAAQIMNTSRSTQSSLLNVLSTTDGKMFLSSIEPSKVVYSSITLTRSVDVPLLSGGMSEIATRSESGLSSTGFSVIGMRSSAHPSPSKTEARNPQTFPSPSATRTNLESSQSFQIRSAQLPAPSYTTSSPLNPTSFLPPQEVNRTKICLPGLVASVSASESDVLANKTRESQTAAFVTVKTESRTTIIFDTAKRGGTLTTSGTLKDKSSSLVFKTLGSKYANALVSSSTVSSSNYKVNTLSKPKSGMLYQKTQSLITAQKPSSTTIFTGNNTKQSLLGRNTATKVLRTTTIIQGTPVTHPTVNSLVSVWSVGTRLLPTPGGTRMESSFPYMVTDVRTKSKGATSTNPYEMRTTTIFAGTRSTKFPSLPLTTVTADQAPGTTHGDASVTSKNTPVINAAQESSRLPMLLAIALIPSIVLIILLIAFVIWRHRRKNNGGPVYNITVEYTDETRPPLAHQNSCIDLTIKGIHIDLEFPKSEKRKSAHLTTATQTGFSEIQMREFQLPKLRQTLTKPKESSLKWLNGLFKKQLEIPYSDSDERSNSSRRPVSVYSAKEKENYEPSEKVTRHESLKCTRETPRNEALRCIHKEPHLDQLELTNEGFDMSTKERKKRTKRKSLASEDDSVVFICAENKNEDQNDNTLKKESKKLDIVKIPEGTNQVVKVPQTNSINRKQNTVDGSKRYDVEHEEAHKDESLLPLPGRRRFLMLRSRFETL